MLARDERVKGFRMLDQDMAWRLVDTATAYEGAMRDFTEALMAVPTENPPSAHYEACVDVFQEELSRLGIEHEVIAVPDRIAAGRQCVLAGHGPSGRTLYFHGHYDVVPASEPEQLRPRRKGTFLFGRGSADMKSGLAAMLYAICALRDCRVPLAGRIGLVVVPDEETGGAGGSRYLADIGRIGRDGIGMLTAEPTGGVVWNANRGAITLRITVRGRSAHVGLQHTGVNAFEGMLDVAAALRRVKAEVETRTTAGDEPEAARRSILLLGGQCTGGSNFNVVPASCEFTVDRRINPEENLAVERARLLAVLDAARARGIELDLDVFQEGESASSAIDAPLARALARSIDTVTGRKPRFALCPGLLETRFYASRGVPAYAYGPGLLSVAHGPHEFVNMRDVVRSAAVYALTAAQLLAAPA
jgi:acetylornithine deacetylase/succinyl-diaminopimelate desuccinylase family protein